MKSRFLVFFFSFAVITLSLWITVNTQSLPPAKRDGFVYANQHSVDDDTILIDAFLDPICPDSRDSWKPLKQAVKHYGSRLRLVVHPFPLPYHDNAYFASRALHIVNGHNTSATFTLLESFFNHQEKFYNDHTLNTSRVSVIRQIVKFAARAVGNSYYTAIESGFDDRQTDLKTRVSFKYGCTRGVYGTPFFFVNGFALPDAGSTITYDGWRKLLDPMVGKKKTNSEEEPMQRFL